jgi:hypothetical protein
MEGIWCFETWNMNIFASQATPTSKAKAASREL